MILIVKFSENLQTNLEGNLNKSGKLLKTFLILLIAMLPANTFAQGILKIDYFGVISSEIDENMYKLTSDLYYTQLCEINNFSVVDKRTDTPLKAAPSVSEISSDSLCFYSIIEKKDESGKWAATLTVINKSNGDKKSQTKEYDSYYKILMEPKSVLQASIKSLISSNRSEINTSTSIENTTEPSKEEVFSITENLSGTWVGEDIIDKIVIMRGGRGFVIFKNGASMNILVNSTGNQNGQIEIVQNARANASFYPDLPRQQALKEAVNAEPIKWNFTLIDNNTLSGTKSTLIADGDTVRAGSVNVTWNRKN